MQLAAQLDLRQLGVRTAVLDRQFIIFAERFMGPEISGHQEIHDRPQVGHAVFDRRTGEYQLVVRLQLLDGAGVPGGTVLNMLGFVECDHGKTVVQVFVEVASDQGVGGNHKIAVRHRFPMLVPITSMHPEDTQMGREFFGFFRPVIDQTGGADDQRRLALGVFALALELQPRERLKSFSQAHLVGQDTAEAAAFEEAHPVDALFLVVAQRTFELVAERNRFEFGIAVLRLGLGHPLRRAFHIDAIECK